MDPADFVKNLAFHYYIFPQVCWDWLYVSKEWDHLAREQIEKNIAAYPMAHYYWPLLWACLGGYRVLIRKVLNHPEFVFPRRVNLRTGQERDWHQPRTALKLLKRWEEIELVVQRLFLLGRNYLVSTGNRECLEVFDSHWNGNNGETKSFGLLVSFAPSPLRGEQYKKYTLECFEASRQEYERLTQKREITLEATSIIKFVVPSWDLIEMLEQKIKARG